MDKATRSERIKAGIKRRYPNGRVGADNPFWRGGKHVGSNGYVEVYMPEHPAAYNRRYVGEHRLVMERAIGRFLTTDEQVHHINGDKLDNRLENLEITTRAQHARHHMGKLKEVTALNQRIAHLETLLKQNGIEVR